MAVHLAVTALPMVRRRRRSEPRPGRAQLGRVVDTGRAPSTGAAGTATGSARSTSASAERPPQPPARHPTRPSARCSTSSTSLKRQAAQGIAPDNTQTVAQYLAWWSTDRAPGADEGLDGRRLPVRDRPLHRPARRPSPAGQAPAGARPGRRCERWSTPATALRTRQYARAVCAGPCAGPTDRPRRPQRRRPGRRPPEGRPKLDDTLTAADARRVLDAAAATASGPSPCSC